MNQHRSDLQGANVPNIFFDPTAATFTQAADAMVIIRVAIGDIAYSGLDMGKFMFANSDRSQPFITPSQVKFKLLDSYQQVMVHTYLDNYAQGW